MALCRRYGHLHQAAYPGGIVGFHSPMCQYLGIKILGRGFEVGHAILGIGFLFFGFRVRERFGYLNEGLDIVESVMIHHLMGRRGIKKASSLLTYFFP